ncbi:MAG: ATP-binding protein [Casimicrobiaceae bacterium]
MYAPAAVHAATFDNLPLFLRFIDDFCARINADADVNYALRLAVEEVCTNLIEHGYAGRPPGPIEVTADRGADRVTLTIRDRAPPFDPASSPAPDLTSDLEHREPGGLGWYLVKQLIDEVRYSPDPRLGNVLTLVKMTGSSRELR